MHAPEIEQAGKTSDLMDIRYENYPPPASIAPYVEHLWAVEGPSFEVPHREILIPNGRPTILVCLAEPGARVPLNGEGVRPNISNSAGLLTRPIILEQKGASSYVAAQLHPWGLRAFGLPSLIDGTQPLSDWLDKEAVQDLEAACAAQPFGRDRVRPLEIVLESRLKPFAPDRLALLERTVAQIAHDDGLSDISALMDHVGVGYDALYRLLRDYVGVSPKQFLSITRFYRFCGSLLQGGYGSLALLASLQGYYDQAHATREFRRFTGITQTEFRTTLNGIAKLMHEIA